jgi:hypothetical protein
MNLNPQGQGGQAAESQVRIALFHGSAEKGFLFQAVLFFLKFY